MLEFPSCSGAWNRAGARAVETPRTGVLHHGHTYAQFPVCHAPLRHSARPCCRRGGSDPEAIGGHVSRHARPTRSRRRRFRDCSSCGSGRRSSTCRRTGDTWSTATSSRSRPTPTSPRNGAVPARLAAIEDIGESKMIIFSPKQGEAHDQMSSRTSIAAIAASCTRTSINTWPRASACVTCSSRAAARIPRAGPRRRRSGARRIATTR